MRSSSRRVHRRRQGQLGYHADAVRQRVALDRHREVRHQRLQVRRGHAGVALREEVRLQVVGLALGDLPRGLVQDRGQGVVVQVRAHAGQVRADVRALDIPVLLMAVAKSGLMLEEAVPGAWKRYLAIILDGLRPEAARSPAKGTVADG